MNRLGLFAILALSLAAPCVRAQRQRDVDRALQPSVLRTSGMAVVKASPDQATLNIGVVNRARTAEEAAAQNAEQVDRVLKAMRATLGDDGEIQTRNYSIYPERDRQGRDITAYTARNTVEVRVTDLAKVGKLIDAATKSGSNQIDGIAFSLRDESESRARALQEAARMARANAAALAEGLGLKVSRILSIEEGQPAAVEPLYRGMTETFSVQADTPIEAGDVEVRASVTMTVAFEQADRR